jgi:hypothetical protein
MVVVAGRIRGPGTLELPSFGFPPLLKLGSDFNSVAYLIHGKREDKLNFVWNGSSTDG